MDALGKWGTQILVPQMLLGALVYAVADHQSISVAITAALGAAGIVAMLFVFFAMAVGKTVGVAVATSSLAATLSALCMTVGSMLFTSIFGFIAITQALLAAKLIQSEDAGTRGAYLAFRALPVLGPIAYFVGLIGKKRA